MQDSRVDTYKVRRKSRSKIGIFLFVCLFLLALSLFTVIVASQLILNVDFVPNMLGSTFVTYRRLGKFGRFGNQLFQVAATIGFAGMLRKGVRIPYWPQF